MPLFLGNEKISKVVLSVHGENIGTDTNDATLTSGTQILSGITAYSKGTKYTGTIATVDGPVPTVSVSDDGLITATVSNPEGYQSSATTKTATQQLTTKEAATFTPTTTDQTIDAGQYLSGAQTIQGDANLIPENIASGISIFGVSGTHQGGIDTSDATATDADIVAGKTAYVNGTQLTGTLVIQNYYTGSSTPDSATGVDGDLFFKVVR